MKKLIIANWKLNPVTAGEARKLSARLDKNPCHETHVCPPHPFLALDLYPHLGAQDCFWQGQGPYTGQVSPVTLKSLGVKYCLVGHSERREVGETDLEIRKKIDALLQIGLRPVVCVGHGTTVTQDELEVVDVLKGQLKSALQKMSEEDLGRVVVAYEPVWAISTGNPYKTKKMATPEHATKIALYAKKKFGVRKVIYGGSVNAVNAEGFLREQHLDGLLVGGASLLPDDFNKIVNIKI